MHHDLKKKVRPVLAVFGLIAAAASACLAQDLTPEKSEIRLDGTVRSVNGAVSALVLNAESFTLPSGKTSKFAAPKAKTVEITAVTKIHVRGDEKRIIPLANLKAGVFLIVIGADSGGGKSLPAREIAVWERMINGRYEFAGPVVTAPVVVPPRPAPVVAPPVVPAPVRPAPVRPPVVTNIVQQPVKMDGDGVAPVTTVADGPLLTVRVKTGSPSAPDEMNLAPGVALPAALAKLGKVPHSFLATLETADEAPENATATLTLPAGLKRPSPGELKIIQPREPPRGMMRPHKVNMYWGSGPAIPAGEPKESELQALIFGYYTHGRRPPERYEGAASVAVGPRAAPRVDGTPPPAPPEDVSAVGDYTLETSYAGRARFKIRPDQDFMEPLKIEMPAEAPDFSQPVTLKWQTIPGAVGYRFKVLGTRSRGTGLGIQAMIWTSSAVPMNDAQDEQTFDDPTQAVKDGFLLPAGATSCTIPAGVLTGMASVSVVAEAFGPGQTIKGNPSVRIIVQSENLFTLRSSEADAILKAEADARPKPRPRAAELPSLFTGETKAWVGIATSVNGYTKINDAPPTADIDLRSSFNRNFSVIMAAKIKAQEELTASLSTPPTLFNAANDAEAKPLSLRVQVPSRDRNSTGTLDARVYWGGQGGAAGQPVTQLVVYEDQNSLGYGTSRTSYNGAGSLAVGPYTEKNEPLGIRTKASAVGAYALQSSYAGNANFNIAAENDFLIPVRFWLASQATDFSKPVTVQWRPVPGALGFRIIAVAQRVEKDKTTSTVIWTSSRNQPADVRLASATLVDVAAAIKKGDALPADAVQAVIPAGIFEGVREMRVSVEAIGPTQTLPGTETSPAIQISTRSVATLGVTQPEPPPAAPAP